MKRGGFLIGICAAMAATCCQAVEHGVYVVTVPVADVRTAPGSVGVAGAHDEQQETQLLYGETVRVLQWQDAWARIEAVEQPEYTHHRRWEGYPGWVLRDLLQPLRSAHPTTGVIILKWATVWRDPAGETALTELPLGTKLFVTPAQQRLWQVRLVNGSDGWISPSALWLTAQLRRLSDAERRQTIVQNARQLLGDPYFWGGRSPSSSTTYAGVTGVDCSGLVNLAYRAAGIDIPRDAHEQHLRAKSITTLQPADLLFLSKANDPTMIVHVMLYAGNDQLIEGPGTGLTVREISAIQRLGKPAQTLRSGDRVGNQTLYLGAYLQ